MKIWLIRVMDGYGPASAGELPETLHGAGELVIAVPGSTAGRLAESLILVPGFEGGAAVIAGFHSAAISLSSAACTFNAHLSPHTATGPQMEK